jgi:hypothetical protein
MRGLVDVIAVHAVANYHGHDVQYVHVGEFLLKSILGRFTWCGVVGIKRTSEDVRSCVLPKLMTGNALSVLTTVNSL